MEGASLSVYAMEGRRFRNSLSTRNPNSLNLTISRLFSQENHVLYNLQHLFYWLNSENKVIRCMYVCRNSLQQREEAQILGIKTSVTNVKMAMAMQRLL
jgi:hypothetical protein